MRMRLIQSENGGKLMANKTVPSKVKVSDFVAGIKHAGRKADTKAVMKMLSQITGKRAKMWGPSIIGYDSYHYKYESGREGDACKIGVSPRAQNLTIYVMPGFEPYKALMKKLGKHTTGASCLYLKRLSDVNEDVLYELLERSYKEMQARYD